MLNFMMQNRWNSVLLTFLFCCLTLIVPPSFVLSGAVIGLVTMRHGWLEAVSLIVFTCLLLYTLSWLITIEMINVIISFLLFWLPTVFLAELVRIKGNIRAAFVFAPIVSVLYWLIIYQISEGDPVGFWRTWIETHLLPVLTKLPVDTNTLQTIRGSLPPPDHMSSILISSVVTLMWLSIIIARLWQSRLYNPKGFGDEFRGLNMGLLIGFVGVVAIMVSFLIPDFSDLLNGLRQVFMLIFLFQGIALVHYMVFKHKLSGVILFFMYVVLFSIPFVGMILSALGALDNWSNFREKIAA